MIIQNNVRYEMLFVFIDEDEEGQIHIYACPYSKTVSLTMRKIGIEV